MMIRCPDPRDEQAPWILKRGDLFPTPLIGINNDNPTNPIIKHRITLDVRFAYNTARS